MRKPRVKWLVSAVLLLALVGGLAWALRPRPVPVDIVAVARGPLLVTVQDDGMVRHRDVFVVAAPVAGRLLRVTLEPGDPVVAGQTTVARMVPAPPAPLDVRAQRLEGARAEAAEAALAAAEAEVGRVAALVELARLELERTRRLRDQEVAARAALEAAQQTFAARRAELAAARSLATARRGELAAVRAGLLEPAAGLAETEGPPPQALALTAPANGVVLRVLETSDRTLAPSQPILEVGDPTDLEVAVDFLSQDAVRIRPGDPARIIGWGGDVLEGRVRRVEPAGFTRISALGIEEQRVWVLVDITAPRDRWGGLAHGYRVEVEVIVERFDDALQIPLGALFRRDGGWAAYVLEHGHAALRPLAIADIGTRTARVTAGLQPGDPVIVFPSDQVGDGVAVAARQSPGS